MNLKYFFLISILSSCLLFPAISSAENIVLRDNFEYVVNRDSDNKASFIAHGWSGAKAENLNHKGKGYIYTTDKIPGYSGKFPGKNSSRVLALEGRPSTFGFQTDFYLQFGGDYDNQVPANVWFQYWVYINDYDDPSDQNDQMSRFGPHPKFIYPTKRGYPSKNGLWLLYSSNNSKEPYSNDLGANASEFYMYLADQENIRYRRRNGKTNWKIGQTNLDDHFIPNRWTLVKIHIDTSTTKPMFEQWIKPMGEQWLKLTEHIQGQTPNLEWHIPANDVGGHRSFRMPTTLNTCRPKANLGCDSWMYLDDFTISTSEAALPTYK